MPELPDDNIESLTDCIEQWDDVLQRDRSEAWLESHPAMRVAFAEQRAIHLALGAWHAKDASHQILRHAIVVSVREEAARQAVKRSILAAVAEEVRGESFRGRVRPWLSMRRWAFRTAVLAMIILCGLFLFWPRPSLTRHAIAHVETVFGSGEVQSEQGTVVAVKQLLCRPGDQVRVGSNGAVSLALSNGVRVQLGPDSALRILKTADSFLLTRGLLKVSMPGQATEAVRLDTPHLEVISEKGELTMQVDDSRTDVHVIAGKARVGRVGDLRSMNVTNGQMLEFTTNVPAATLAPSPFWRDAWNWPFSVDSPWNTSIGSRSVYARINSSGWPAKNLTNTILTRPIIVAGGTNLKINLLAPGEAPRSIRYPASWNPEPAPDEIVCAFFPGENLCCEMTEPIRLPSLDIRVRERNSTDLLSHGVGWSWPRPRIVAGSAFAGLIRRGELTFGIQHALALAVNARYINGDNGSDGHRWPGVPVAPELVRQFGVQGNLALGALLAIPPTVDLRSLGLGTAGPGFEISRALQDYGAYVIQTTDAELKLIAAADAGLPPEIDEIVNRVVPHLHLVSNNSSRNIGGGGVRRRPLAPPVLQTTPRP